MAQCLITFMGILQQLGGTTLCVISGLTFFGLKNLSFVDGAMLLQVCSIFFLLGVIICVFAGFVMRAANRETRSLFVLCIILVIAVAPKVVIIMKYDIWDFVGPFIDAGISPKLLMLNLALDGRDNLVKLVFNREDITRKIFFTSLAFEGLQFTAALFLYLRRVSQKKTNQGQSHIEFRQLRS